MGNRKTIPYTRSHGETVGEAIARVFADFSDTHIAPQTVKQDVGIESRRAQYLGGGWFQKLFPLPKEMQNLIPHRRTIRRTRLL